MKIELWEHFHVTSFPPCRGQNNTFSLPWEIRSIFMQNCFIVSALQHGRRENPLLENMQLLRPPFQCHPKNVRGLQLLNSWRLAVTWSDTIYVLFTRDTFTWGKLWTNFELTFLYCVTFSIVKWHLPHVNVSRVNTALVKLLLLDYILEMLVRDISPEKRSGVNMFGTNAFSDGTA